MTLNRIKRNLGFLLAGAILFGVAVNVYMELKTPAAKETECRSPLIP